VEGTKRSSELFGERLEQAQGEFAGGCCVAVHVAEGPHAPEALDHSHLYCARLQRCPLKHSRGFWRTLTSATLL